MVTSLDTELRQAAVDLLATYGKGVTFVVRTKTPHADTGQTTYGTEPDVVVKATPPAPFAAGFGPADVSRYGNTVIYVADQGLTFTPTVGMQVVIDGAKLSVVRAERFYSGDLVALWEIDARS